MKTHTHVATASTTCKGCLALWRETSEGTNIEQAHIWANEDALEYCVCGGSGTDGEGRCSRCGTTGAAS